MKLLYEPVKDSSEADRRPRRHRMAAPGPLRCCPTRAPGRGWATRHCQDLHIRVQRSAFTAAAWYHCPTRAPGRRWLAPLRLHENHGLARAVKALAAVLRRLATRYRGLRTTATLRPSVNNIFSCNWHTVDGAVVPQERQVGSQVGGRHTRPQMRHHDACCATKTEVHELQSTKERLS